MTRRTLRRSTGLVAATVVAVAAACLASPGFAAGVAAGFQPSAIAVAPGDTFTVEIAVTAAGDEFNAFDAAIRFDPARLAFVPTSPLASQRGALMTAACANTFHLFSAQPDSLLATLSLLCSNVFVTGPGVVYRVRFRALPGAGVTTIELGPATAFYRAGFFVLPLAKGTMTVTIGTAAGVPGAPGRAGVRLAPPRPNPARGTGVAEFELAEADRVRLELLDAQGRRVALLADARFEAGPARVPVAVAAPAGVYRLRMTTGRGAVRERRWVVLR